MIRPPRRLGSRPIAAAVALALAVAAAACSDDDSTDPALPSTTAPLPPISVEDEPSPTTVAPDDADATTTSAPAAPAPPTTPVPDTVEPPPDGDPAAADVTTAVITTLDEPIDTVVAPNGEWWVAERSGTVVVVDPASGAVGEVVVDVSDRTRAGGERGLLGMAVDDDHLFLDFTDVDGNTRVEARPLDATGRPGTAVELLFQEQPFSNHNGGGLAIGPDGHLYIGFGDGGSGGDPLDAGQDPTTWLGALLRIAPTPDDPTFPYVVAADNPFADGDGGRPEIYLTGVRNPWRFSFDPVTGDLWLADVGQDAVEEVNRLAAADGAGLGANLGWRLREGTAEFAGPRPEGNVDPVFEYRHGDRPGGCSVTGGHVYRGTAIPQLVGAYLFGDYCTSALWALSVDDAGAATFHDLDTPVPGGDLVGFGVDPDGELVTLSLDGEVARIVPA